MLLILWMQPQRIDHAFIWGMRPVIEIENPPGSGLSSRAFGSIFNERIELPGDWHSAFRNPTTFLQGDAAPELKRLLVVKATFFSDHERLVPFRHGDLSARLRNPFGREQPLCIGKGKEWRFLVGIATWVAERSSSAAVAAATNLNIFYLRHPIPCKLLTHSPNRAREPQSPAQLPYGCFHQERFYDRRLNF